MVAQMFTESGTGWTLEGEDGQERMMNALEVEILSCCVWTWQTDKLRLSSFCPVAVAQHPASPQVESFPICRTSSHPTFFCVDRVSGLRVR